MTFRPWVIMSSANFQSRRYASFADWSNEMSFSRKKDLIRSWLMTTPLIDWASRFATVLFPEPGAPDIWMSSLGGGGMAHSFALLRSEDPREAI